MLLFKSYEGLGIILYTPVAKEKPLKQLLYDIFRGCVEKPDEIHVEELCSDRTCVYEITCAKTDMGRLIGRNGKTAEAVRTIMNAHAAMAQTTFILRINDHSRADEMDH